MMVERKAGYASTTRFCRDLRKRRIIAALGLAGLTLGRRGSSTAGPTQLTVDGSLFTSDL